jgi:hypothetical protein
MYQAKQAGTGVHGAAASITHTGPPPGTRCRDLRRRT